MKRKFRRIASMVLAMALVFAMAMPAMAADITINSAVEGHTYKAYQILKGTILKEGESYNIGNAEWGKSVTEDGKAALGDLETFLDSLKGRDAKELAQTLVSGADGKNYIDRENPAASVNEITDGKYKLSGLEPGYYLIIDEAAEGMLSAYIIDVAMDGDAEVNPKVKSEPEFEKKVDDVNDSKGTSDKLQDSADYDIGDTVPFTLTIKLPEDYADYEHYYVKVTDDMSDGLTLDRSSFKISLKGDSKDLPEGALKANGDDLDDFLIEIQDLKTLFPAAVNNDEIVITYSAVLNGDAKIGADGNPNTAFLTYQRNPSWNGQGTPSETKDTPKDTVIVFTFKADVNKVDEEGNELAGAAFALFKKINDKAGYSLKEGEAWVDPENEKYKNYEAYKDWLVVKQFTAGEVTSFTFSGLDDGEYVLVETTTPDGYNTIDPIEFTIEAAHDTDAPAPALTDLKVKDKGGNEIKDGSFEVEMESGTISTEVENAKGATLPETGGIGTTIFYVVGSVLVLAAVILLVTKRRMHAE